MAEIDLMDRYPKTERKSIIEERELVSEEDRRIAQKFGWEYFDGPRKLGLGGYYYDEKFFKPVVEQMIQHYGLTAKDSILDVGCAKGFMLHDFVAVLGTNNIAGVDISEYCLHNAMDSVKSCIMKASCDSLPFKDSSFDLVVSIATIHNLDIRGVTKSLEEIVRVSRKHAFIKVNGYHTKEQQEALENWNLVAKTILHVNEWKALFEKTGYQGDFFWFTP